jgi:hypothetical protein
MCLASPVFGKDKQHPVKPSSEPEVIIGSEVWSYQRVFPLLDGLFQDVANTQVQSALLNPNSANGSQTDALQQAFQLQAGYSQLNGLTNSLYSQMASANSSFQSTLLQQQGSLLQQQISAQQQLGQAQDALTTAQANGDTTAVQKQQQAVTIAQNNLASLTAQMAYVKAQLAAPTYSPTSASTQTTPSTTAFTGIPSSVVSAASGNATPSFPATKQMDNEIELLWERLSRLVGAMTRPDSLGISDGVYLVQFDTGIFPIDRKKQLLDIGYTVSCNKNTGEADPTNAPIVIDMFPRMAAVNITNTKYRDSAAGFGAVLAWMGFGVNLAYNREHLRVSQLLGQSSYITGYGIGQHSFGWKFGIPLGDDQISSDTKKTFVLVDVPSGCEVPKLALERAAWSKPRNETAPTFDGNQFTNVAKENVKPKIPAVTEINFNRTSFDPTTVSSANPATVGLMISVDTNLDQQETLTVNGMIIKRARDTFGRGTTGSGSGGLLEASSLVPNSWVPIGSKEILLSLDGSQFGEHFPTIGFSSPNQQWTLNGGINGSTVIEVSGRTLQCLGADTCATAIPSLAYRKPVIRHIASARWIQSKRTDDKVSFTVNDVTASSPSSPASMTGLPAVQEVSGATQQQWGSNAEVYRMDPATGSMTRLKCDPINSSVSRLTCNLGPGEDHSTDYIYRSAQYEIIDPDHNGGPIEGWASTDDCSIEGNSGLPMCGKPTEWGISNPVFIKTIGSHGGWLFDVVFVNVDSTWKASLNGISKSAIDLTCVAERCSANYVIAAEDIAKFSDLVTLTLEPTHPDRHQVEIHIANLYTNMEPLVTSLSTDKTSWSGTNLTDVFSSIEVGKGGNKYPMTCSSNVACQVDPKKSYGKNDNGYLYLMSGAIEIPLMAVNGSGTPVPVFYAAPAQTTAGKNPAGTQQTQAASPTTSPNSTQQLQSLQNFQQSTSVVASQQLE